MDSLKKKRKGLRPIHIIALSFLVLITMGSLLLWLPISHKGGLSFLDAFFTATSATCLTGLHVVHTATTFTVFGQIIILLLIQLGGLGLMTCATMILMILRKRFTIKDRLLMQEALGQNQNKGIVRLTRNVTVYVFACEGIGMAVLLPFFIQADGAKGIYYALFTAVSAFCNAGFDVFNTPSLTRFADNPAVLLIISALIILGSIGFAVALDLGKSKFRLKRCHLHTQVVLFATLTLLVIGTLVFLSAECTNPDTMRGMNFGNMLANSFFLAVAGRTAGFYALDTASLSLPSSLFTLGMMFVGGSPASASGGIKTTTFAVLVFMFSAGIRRKGDVVVFRHTIPKKTCLTAAAVAVAGVFSVLLLSFALAFTEKSGLTAANMYTMDNIIFEAFSAISTCGLTKGITPYLSVAGKIIVCISMLIGKLGAVSIGAIIFSTTDDERLRYPEGYILIG